MLIDFNSIKETTIPGMNHGTGEMTAKMYMDDDLILLTVIVEK